VGGAVERFFLCTDGIPIMHIHFDLRWSISIRSMTSNLGRFQFVHFLHSHSTAQARSDLIMSDLPEPIQRLGLLILTLTLTFLRPLALLISTCSTPISPTFYPFPLATTLHALRISHAYKGRVKALGHEGAMKVRGRAVELAGYLAMVSNRP
jgi:hypothetical protein